MSASPVRCLAVWLTATAGTVALVVWLLSDLGLGDPVRFDQALARLAAAVAALMRGLAVGRHDGGGPRGRDRRHPGRPGVPAPVRRLVLAACGAAVLAGLAAPVSATPGDLHRDRRPVASLAGLPFPDRAVGAPARTPAAGAPTWSSYARETRSGTWPAPTSAPAPTPRPWTPGGARSTSSTGPSSAPTPT